MRKVLLPLCCAMACTTVFAGCSAKDNPAPTEEFQSSFITEDEIAQTTPVVDQSTENENTDLVFGEHTYNDSVQINQKELGWATYDSIPNDIFLFYPAFFPCDSICQMPDWEDTQVIDNVAVSRKDNNVIAVSILRMSELDSTEILSDELMNLMKSDYGVQSFDLMETIIDETDYQYWHIVKGIINGQENLKYIVKTYNDGEFGYTLYAAWDENDIYTQERMEQTLSDIRMSFNLYPLGPEGDMDNSESAGE